MRELSPYFLQRDSRSTQEEVPVLNEPLPVAEEAHLRDYWRVVRKHRRLILVFFLCTIFATVLFVLTSTPIYTAETTVLIERKTPQAIDIQGALSELQAPDEYDYYRTQYEILKGRGLAARVIREEGLENNDLFTGEGEQKGLIAKLWAKIKARIEQFLPAAPETETTSDSLLGVDPYLIDAYLDMLEVKPVPRTRLVKVALSTPSAELSAQVVNAHVKAYIQQGVDLRTQANEEAQGFLEEKMIELKERVEKSEAALNSYRRDKGILSLDDKENIIVDRLSDLNKLLTAAEADRIASEAQLHLIRKRAYDFLPEVISNSLIQTLKGQQTSLQGEYAQLADRFKPDYPRLSQLRAQLAEIQQRLNREMQKVAASLESTYQAAETREKGLRAKMEEQKAATLRLKDDSVNYAILAREVDTNRQLYDSVLQRMKEMGVAAEVRSSNVSTIDPGEPPLRPSRPRKLLSLLLSSVVGLMGGVGLAFFLEYLDNSLRNPEEAERYLGLPNLAVVPDFLRANHHGDPEPKAFLSVAKEAARRISGKPAQEQLPTPDQELVLFHHPFSAVTEAYRTLRTAILLSRADEAPRTILFTSAAAGEGKTVTTVNLATIFAQMDLRVLVVDADLRRPRCHQVLRAPNGAGLTELLTGQREMNEIIKPTTTENLFLMSSGAVPPNPAELMGSRKMHDTLKILQGDYDCVFIDSPPVMPVSDTLLLSTLVDGVVLVINGQGTPRQLVREAHSRLTYARAKILGVVLNRVNMQAGDYPYYYYHYASYYHHTNGKEEG